MRPRRGQPTWWRKVYRPRNLVVGDFLGLRAGQDLSTAGAVVGNPPYVRHHRLTAAAKATAAAAAAAAGVRLSGRASLWAYFVIHAAGYVELGGRMALLLPGAVTHADYAAAVIEHLESRFDDVVLVRVSERIFTDAEEETVVLLAAGAREAGHRVTARFHEVDDLAGLERLLDAASGKVVGRSSGHRGRRGMETRRRPGRLPRAVDAAP